MNRQAVLVGVHVQEREVALAQRDEVALGAQVVLDGDGPAVAGDREAELGLLRRPCVAPSVERDAQAVDVDALGGRGQRLGAHGAVDGEVVGERVAACSPTREVGEHAVGARRRRSVTGTDQVPSARWVGCRCWKPVMSRRTTMRCMRLVCSTSKSRTVRPSRSTIRKASVERLALRRACGARARASGPRR